MAHGILVPQPGIEPMPPAVEAWRLNHGAAREVPKLYFLEEKPISSDGCHFHALSCF